MSALDTAPLRVHMDTARVGRFCYLEFNKAFTNWYITRDNNFAGMMRDRRSRADPTSRFRVGLRHNMDEDEVDEVGL